MAIKNYKDENSLKSIDDVFRLCNEILESNSVVIKEGKAVPPSIGLALGGALGAGTAGTAGIGVGTASLVGGTAATIGGVALLPIVAPVALLSGIGYLLFKNKKDKELHNKKLARYKEAIRKQNEIIKMYEVMHDELVKSEERLKKENVELRKKLEELLAVNEALLKIIEELRYDLKAA